MRTQLPPWIAPAVVAAAFLLFLLAETRRPLRRSRESKLRRVGRNLATAGIGLATVELLQIPILVPVSRWTMARGFGLLRWFPGGGVLRVAAGVLLLDYALWFWHWANHRIGFLWRFHSVHHVDRDMDASTGLRFHFGELGLSVFFRALQIVVIGADPVSVTVWQTLLFVSVLFHHSNTRLPIGVERVLVRFVVTPRMHGIHHSDFQNETNTNWSSLLSAWDYLHGTILLGVPQEAINVGVPAYDDSRKVTLGRILALPFLRRGDDWTRADGRPLVRPHPEPTRTTLVA
jgi:sterol desaturase/sphingolipid hydroxylase (fatty acid hydroxylase superfamily)